MAPAAPAVAVSPEVAFSQGGDNAGAGNTTTTGNNFIEIKLASPMTVSDAPNLQTIRIPSSLIQSSSNGTRMLVKSIRWD
jgi:hypothetical protein